MAIITKSFLDLTGLTTYDTAIKEWANSVNQLGFKTALTDANGNYLYLYVKSNAILGTDTPDATIALGSGELADKLDALASVCGATWDSTEGEYVISLDASFDAGTDTIVEALNELKGQINILNGSDSTSGSVAKTVKDAIDALDVTEFPIAEVDLSGVVTIHGIKENNGAVAVGTNITNDIVLEEIATTGAAADVSIVDAGGYITATDVEGALQELASAASGGVASKTIYVTDNSAGQSDYAKVYKIWQGAHAPDAVTDPATLIGTINIPKDKVLQDASIVDITYDDGSLYDGLTDVTELIVGSGTATEADAGKYLKMEMQNVTDPLYVNLQVFVDVYTVESGASEIQLALSNHEFSASVVSIDGAKIVYKTETSAGAGDGETVKAALTRLDGSDSTTGSVAKKIKDAIEALDTSSDVDIATYEAGTSGAADVITLTGSLQEVNGVISAGSGDTITLSTITTAQINSLFS